MILEVKDVRYTVMNIEETFQEGVVGLSLELGHH